MNDHTAVTLRAVRTADAEALARIADMPGVRAGTLRLPFESAEFWQRRIASSSPDSTWIVADVAGVVVGHGVLTPHGAARLAHGGQVMLLAVADDQAGAGSEARSLQRSSTSPKTGAA